MCAQNFYIVAEFHNQLKNAINIKALRRKVRLREPIEKTNLFLFHPPRLTGM
jgi:hypothetical protein